MAFVKCDKESSTHVLLNTGDIVPHDTVRGRIADGHCWYRDDGKTLFDSVEREIILADVAQLKSDQKADFEKWKKDQSDTGRLMAQIRIVDVDIGFFGTTEIRILTECNCSICRMMRYSGRNRR
jgi:hypothetical protein